MIAAAINEFIITKGLYSFGVVKTKRKGLDDMKHSKREYNHKREGDYTLTLLKKHCRQLKETVNTPELYSVAQSPVGARIARPFPGGIPYNGRPMAAPTPNTLYAGLKLTTVVQCPCPRLCKERSDEDSNPDSAIVVLLLIFVFSVSGLLLRLAIRGDSMKSVTLCGCAMQHMRTGLLCHKRTGPLVLFTFHNLVRIQFQKHDLLHAYVLGR